MDENNMSEGDMENKATSDENGTRSRNNKRPKTQPSPSTEGINNEVNNVKDSDTAGTSNDNVPLNSRTRTKRYRNRNYRNNRREDSSPNESCDEDDPICEDNDSDATTNVSSQESLEEEEAYESDGEGEVLRLLKKPKPSHTWYVVPEVMKRQFGYSSKLHSAELFRNQCYGSLHSVQRLELMYKLEEHYGCVNSLNFHPDGSLLASGSDDLSVVVWDWKLGKCLFKFVTKHRLNIFQSKFLNLQGDLHIATCARDGQVRLSRASREGGVRENRKLGTHKEACHKIAVLQDQPHIILSAAEDGVVLSHDIRKTKSDQIVSVKREGRPVPLYSISAHPLRTHEFCVAGQEDTVKVYDQRKTTTPLSTYIPFEKSSTGQFCSIHVTSAVYNYDGQEILASYNDADIYLFEVNSRPGEYFHKYQGHRNGATIKGVSFFGPRSEFIVSGSDCGHIFFWEKRTEAIVQCMLGDDSGVVNCLEPHPSLPFLCTSGLDWDVKVWVPSCETEPNLEKLPQLVESNTKSKRNVGLAADAPVLWMLWQHLRRSSSSIRRELQQMNFGSMDFAASSGSEEDDRMYDANVDDDVDDEDDDDDEDDIESIDFTSECTTS